MLPCIGQIVVPPAGKATFEGTTTCHICGRIVTGAGRNMTTEVAMCSLCHERLMKAVPFPAQ